MGKKLSAIVLLFIMSALLAGCSKAASLDKEGEQSFRNGDYEKAATCFSAAIAANPNRAEYYINYGLTLIALGKYDEALMQFDQAYLEKDLLIVRENNKRILRGKGIAYYSGGQYSKAIEEFQKALDIRELTELNVDILYYMADTFLIQGAYEDAVSACTDIITLDKKAAKAYSIRANCYKLLGDYEKSLADYDEAIKLDSDNYEHYFGKYFLLVDRNDEAGAYEALKMAEAIEPKTKEDQYNLAKLHFYQGNYELALSEFSDRYADGFAEANYYIGEIYRLKKDYAKAIYYYEYYIDSGEVTSPNIFNQIAVCLLKTDQAKEALEYLEQGVLYGNANILPTLKKNEIIAYEYLGRYEEAHKKLEEYLRSYPGDAKVELEATFIETRVLKITE